MVNVSIKGLIKLGVFISFFIIAVAGNAQNKMNGKKSFLFRCKTLNPSFKSPPIIVDEFSNIPGPGFLSKYFKTNGFIWLSPSTEVEKNILSFTLQP